MISCIFAYAKGAESQSTAVEFVDPMSALFLVKNDPRARCALTMRRRSEPSPSRLASRPTGTA